jgi:outer membrane protein assembly factor BamB
MTEPHGFALGVDLGTSNTVAVLRWPDGRTRPLLFDGQPIMPSGVFLDQAGILHVGRDAQRLARSEPGRYEPNPKRRIDEAGVLLGDREVATVDLLAAVLGAVARAAVEAVGFLPPAVLTYPAAWGSRRRETLASAVARAGWPPVDPASIHTGAMPGAGGPGTTLMVPEPVAAARYFADVLRRPVPAGASLAVFDLGGGTLDVAVVRNEGPDPSGRARFAVIGSGGVAELGGLDLDGALVEHLGGVLTTTAPHSWRQLNAPQSQTEWRNRGQFWDDVRGAKEMLSRTSAAPVAVPGVDQAVHLTREELERLATPLLRRGVYEAARVIADCRLQPGQLAGLFLVGGSSRVPLVARMLHTDLGIPPTVLEQPELPVAEGALTELAPAPASAALAQPAMGAARAVAPASPAAPAAPATPPPSSPAPPPLTITGAAGAAADPYQMTDDGPRRRGRLVIWLAAAAAAVVLLAAAGVAWFLNRGPSDLAFQDVTEIVRIGTGDTSPPKAFTQVVGDRAYLAWQREDQLEVIAVNAGTGEEQWRVNAGGTSEQWGGIAAYPNVVVVFAFQGSASEPRSMYVHDAGDGQPLWSRDIYGEDQVLVYDEVVVLVDNQDDRLAGLDPRTGEERWATDNPRDDSDNADASVFAATTEADFAGSAGATGAPFAPSVDDDYRLVQVGADNKARVIDARTGAVLRERGNIGESSAKFLAYGGRLFVAGSGGGYQIDAYDLESMGDPATVYRAPDEKRSLTGLAPCGKDRICLLDSSSGDSATVEIASVDAAKGGQRWRQPAPEADALVPVGDGVLVLIGSGTSAWTLRDGEGKELVRREGTAARLDGANLLSFGGSLSSSPTDVSVAGVLVDGGKVTELGPLHQARGESCSWNARVIACMTEKDFALWRFAAE